MTDLLISTPEEFRTVVSSHVYRNLDTVRGYLVDSQNTFLRQRLGQPLIKAMLEQYTTLKPIVPNLAEDDHDNYELLESRPWVKLIQLAQRCIAYDGLYRSAGIRRVSDNDMGINVAESDNFAAVDKDRFAEYKIDLYKGAHSASDMLLTQLQEWEKADGTQAPTDAPATEPSPEAAAIATIIALWRQSPTYPLTDGLLFTTATEFNTYINIQQSLDKFVELLPDIRYCQELHLEAEIGADLLAYFQQGHRQGTLTPSGEKAYTMLQRTLSLYVEARSPMFKRQDARDEAQGYMRLTRNYIMTHQTDYDRRAMSQSPLFVLPMWPRFDADGNPLAPDGTPLTYADGTLVPPAFDEYGHPVYPDVDAQGRPDRPMTADNHRHDRPGYHCHDERHAIVSDHSHGRPCPDRRDLYGHDCHDPYRRHPGDAGFLETTMI